MRKFCLCGLFAAMTAPAFATPITVISNTGANNGAEINWTAESWTQTGNYTGVSISATLDAGNAMVYLLDQLGPGTTMANEVVPSENITVTGGFQDFTLFSGLTLGPGTYYLLIDPTSAALPAFWLGGFISGDTLTTDTGVTFDNEFTSRGAIAGFSPATADQVTNSGAHNFFAVSGNVQAASTVPEPGTWTLMAAGLGVVAIFRRKRV
jgi:hypothetical protein